MISGFTEMTDRMQALYMDIIASLGQLPTEKKVFLFGNEENEDMDWVIAVANYITLEYIKYSFDYNDPKFSMRHFMGDVDDSERMLQSRIVQYILKYKKKERERRNNLLPDNKYGDIEMNSIEHKLKGYRITEMNYYEHQNIHDLEIIKAIVEKRIGSAKKVSNPRFKEMFEQYDNMIAELYTCSNKSNHDMVFSSLALFTIEWKYAIETLYRLACIMEKKGLKDVDLNALILLIGGVWIESRFGGSAETDSRMVKERLNFLEYLFDERIDKQYKNEIMDLIKETLVIVVYYKEYLVTNEGELYKEWFRKESTEEDWASFFRYYNMFDIWQRKEWTRKRIQNLRTLLDRVAYPKD